MLLPLCLAALLPALAVDRPCSSPSTRRSLLSRHFRVAGTAVGAALISARRSRAASICGSCGAAGPCYCVSQLVSRESQGPWYNPVNERIYDVSKRSFLPVSQLEVLEKELQGRQVVCVGEVHSNPCHHRVEFEVVKALSRHRSPRSMNIGLECFYRQHQRALDEYVFQHRDFGILKRQTRWDATWGYDLNQYAKIFNYACRKGIRLVGLNVPYPVVRLVSSLGIAQLPADLKPFLPSVDISNQEHRSQFLRLVGAHGGASDDPGLERMYEAQCLWDDYMADSAALVFDSQSRDSLLVVIAGVGHVLGRVGIPDRIAKRIHQSPFVIVPEEVNWSEETGLPDVERPPGASECDWAWYTEREFERRA